jgi:hypothetical protein
MQCSVYQCALILMFIYIHFLSNLKNYFLLNSNMCVLWTWIFIADVHHPRNNIHRPVHTPLGSQWQLLCTFICTRWVPAPCLGHLSWFSHFKGEYFWQTHVLEAKYLSSYYFQIKQPTRCNSSSSLLLDVYIQLIMFRASSRPSSGAQQLQ